MKQIPTITELYQGIIADIEAELDVDIPEEGKNHLRSMAAVWAGEDKMQYLAIGQVQKNIFIDSADPVADGGTLERFGVVKMNRYPFAASQGVYTATVTGQTGSTIPAGTTWKSDDDAQNPGYLFILDTEYTLPSTSGTILLRALQAGTEALLNVGETLTATQPINDVDATATVATVSSEPQDAEDIEDYRRAGINSFRLEPQGGAPADYILWAADAQGVVRAYPYAKSGSPNEIDLYIEGVGTVNKGVPSAGILSDVEDVIELDPDTTLPLSERGRRPLGVFAVNVQAILPLDVDITVTGLVDSTAEKEELIEAALRELVGGIRPFIAGADDPDGRNDTLSLNRIITAIQSALPGQEFTSVSMDIDSSAETSYEFDEGEIPYANTVVFA